MGIAGIVDGWLSSDFPWLWGCFQSHHCCPGYEHNSQIRHGMLESQIWARQTFGRERHGEKPPVCSLGMFGQNLNVSECPEGMNRATPAFKHFPTAWCKYNFPACYKKCLQVIHHSLWKKVFCCHLFWVQKVSRSSNRIKHFEALNWLNIFLFAALAAFYSWFSMWGLPRRCNDFLLPGAVENRYTYEMGDWPSKIAGRIPLKVIDFFWILGAVQFWDAPKWSWWGPMGPSTWDVTLKGYLLEWCRRISPFPITQISWLLSLVKHMNLCRYNHGLYWKHWSNCKQKLRSFPCVQTCVSNLSFE